MCTSLSLADQDRAIWIMQSPRLLEWLNAPRSLTLLINGNGESNDMFSSTTLLSAKLLECLGQTGRIISHHFFCSLHTSSSASSKDDATGLVKSFVCQLLTRDMSWDLSFLSQKHLEEIGSGDLETTCMLFRKLVQQMPNKTFLFWVVDGINYYERSQWRPDFLKVIPELLEIIRGCNDVIIKLLLTCHGKSSFVKDALEKDDILTAPFDVGGCRQGWSERTFQRTIGPEIEKLKAATQNIGTMG